MTHLTFAHLASVHGPIIWEPRSGRSFVQEEREMRDRKIERYMWHCSQMTDAEVATLTLSMATWHLAWQPEVSS